jgi:hypothetical protein
LGVFARCAILDICRIASIEFVDRRAVARRKLNYLIFCFERHGRTTVVGLPAIVD